MTSTNRLIWASIAVATAIAACRDPSSPSEPRVAGAITEATTAQSVAPVVPLAIVIEDALVRVIPGLEGGNTTDELHDAFDRVADALESDDPRLAKLVADAGELLTKVSLTAPPDWSPDLAVLRLALDALTARSERGPKK